MTGVELAFTSTREQAELVASGSVTARELVEHALERIGALDYELNAFVHVLADEARAEAEELDRRQADGATLGPLHGVPIAITDGDAVAGVPTGSGSAAYTTSAPADSEVVRRLREAGAIIIGKTRMPEFGLWPFTESSAQGYTRNPWNPLFSPGGSSGGSAVAVASGMVAAAIGGDGGGSLRIPASWCGLYGLKCQRGRVSLAPNARAWGSLGVIGPLTRTVEDSALIYDVISGYTEIDAWKAAPLENPLLEVIDTHPGALRIAVSLENPTSSSVDVDAETVEAINGTVAVLRELGHTVTAVEPHYPKLGTVYSAQVIAGVADSIARSDHPKLVEKRTAGVVRLARPLIAGATRAEQRSIEMGREFEEAFFSDYDLLLIPTTPWAALPVGQLDGEGALSAMRKASPIASFTRIWNVFGNPAAAIPIGLSSAGLPLSAQLVGPSNSEARIVQVSAQLEWARPWAERHPQLS